MSYVVTNSLNGLGDVCTVMSNGARVCGPQPSIKSSGNRSRSYARVGGRNIIGATTSPVTTTTTTSDGTGSATGRFRIRSKETDRGYGGPGGFSRSTTTSDGTDSATGRSRIRSKETDRGYGGPGGFSRSTQSGQQNQNQYTTAQLQSILQTNPSALTSDQWSQLQSAGFVASTLPYSSASQVATASTPTSSTAGTDTTGATGIDISSIPIWVWGILGLVVLMFVMKHK